MKELINQIIHSVLTGRDYRTYVLATINKRFIDKVKELTTDIFEYKERGDNWLEKLLEDTSKKRGKTSKFKLLWYGGLNDKTVKNMTGGTSNKKICLELGKRNLESFRLLLSEIENESSYRIKITIKKDDKFVELDDLESVIFINIISTMKLTVQGGAWSEVGKQVEKSLLYVIFSILKIPKENYVLIFDDMKEKGLVGNREIDAIVFNKNGEPITIELKLLGIGNPEIGDEALAREVDLFLVDRLTEMMIKESEEIGVKVIEFRQENPLKEIYNFFSSKGVTCAEPEDMTPDDLKRRIEEIIKDWQESKEEYKILKKLKELTK